MITRAFSSTTIGLAVTLGLFYVMQYLIATGEEVLVDPRKRQIVTWISPPEPPEPAIEPAPPEKIDKPPVPPVIERIESTTNTGFGIRVPGATPTPPPGSPTLRKFAQSDGPLINVIKVRPQYPAAAEARGLSGTVLVQFDVTETGTVENVIVVESTHRVFNKAAIRAAYRFRYKPRVVDGTPYGTRGLQQLFRFELQN